MESEKDKLEETFKSFQFLNDLGYKIKYAQERDPVITYHSYLRKQNITIQAFYFGSEISCIIRKASYFVPLFSYSPNNKNVINVNDKFRDDEDFKKLQLKIDKDNWKTVVNEYAKFLERRLINVISGKQWFK